jgi:hypothetical protein
MNPRKTAAKRNQKGRPKRKVVSLPAAPGPAENNRLDEPTTLDRNDVVSMEISGSVKTRREDPDVCGIDDETILDSMDLH